MKTNLHQWKMLILLAFFVSSTSFAQKASDWTKDESSLYYIGANGKVFLKPDYSAMAVYFDNAISSQVKNNFKSEIASARGAEKVKDSDIEMMDTKGIMRIKSSAGLKSINTSQNRADFLKSYKLTNSGAYDVLPAFKMDGMQAWFTKRVVVKLKDGVSFSAANNLMSKYGAKFLRNITDDATFLLEVNKIENQLRLIQELHESGLLQWGEPDFKMELKKMSDPMYPDQWHLNNTGGNDLGGSPLVNDLDIDAPEAWSIAPDASNVTVAVIDDGMEAHEDFETLLPGYTPANNGDGTPDSNGDHGQACGGLIGALHNNIGVRGVAPGVRMFSINIFAANTSNADVADGINWAVNNGADVLSNSWGFSSCTTNISSITAAFNNAATNGRGGLGCIILVASGNDFGSCVSYPADLPSVTAVGGISGDGQRSNYSNYGPALDIVAPTNDAILSGSSIIGFNYGMVTTDREGSSGYNSSNYDTNFGGTSAATPVAAGVAALVLSVNPSLTKAEVENILYTTADDEGPSGFDNEYGHGRINAYQAVLAAGGTSDTTPPSVPTALASSNIASTSFDISWTASTDDNAVTGYNIYLNGSNIGTSPNNSASVTGLIPNTNYTVAVSAFDGAGNESAQSSSINVTTSIATLSCNAIVSSYPYSESFESNDGWTQISGDDGNWVRGSGSTPSSGTGPSSGAEGSFYMFLEASTNNSPGQIGNNATAILESDCFDLSSATSATFSFQNHMNGNNIGSLTIQVSADDQTWSNIWALSGSQGNQWNTVDINLDTYIGSSIKLRIVGTTGDGWSSDIAIDGLTLTTESGADTEAPTAPGNLTASNITQTTASLSWSASSDNVGVIEYEVFSSGVSIGTVIGTSANITGLTANTGYSYTVRAKDAAGNVSVASNTASFSTLPDNVTYCDSQGNNSSFEWIDFVSLSDMSNSTGNNGGYQDFTSNVATVSAGQNYTITVSAGFSGTLYLEFWKIWIDFNQDGIFDEDTEQVTSGSSSSPGNLTATISIPASASLGNTRMRVSMKYNASQTSCETFTYGEVEDYTVNITANGTNSIRTANNVVSKSLGNEQGVDFRVFPNPASDYLNFTIPRGTESIAVYSATGSKIENVTIRQSGIDISRLRPGVYMVIINTEKGSLKERFVKQ